MAAKKMLWQTTPAPEIPNEPIRLRYQDERGKVHQGPLRLVRQGKILGCSASPDLTASASIPKTATSWVGWKRR